MNWEIKKLNECCLSISDGDHFPPPKSESGIPFVTIVNVDAFNHFDFTDTMYVPESYYDRLDDKRKARKGDILFTVVGSFGIPILITDNIPFVFQRHIAILRPDPAVIDSRFLYYTMLSKSFFAQADAYAVGAAQRTISLTSLRRMKIAIPDLCAQKKISDRLSSFDRLIDGNNKQIELLEKLAENIYREWFLRFRFPGYEKAEFENGFPKGWETIRLGERMTFLRGKSYSSSDIQDGDKVLLSMNNIRPYGGFIRDFTRVYGGKYQDKHVVKYGDLLMSITDMTQDRRIIGYVGLFDSNRTDCIMSTHLMKIETDIDHLFLLNFFNVSGLSKMIAEFATGANVLGLTDSILKRIKAVFPSDDLIEQYGKAVKPYYDMIAVLKNENDNLIKQRNLLLPRLMSGKLEM